MTDDDLQPLVTQCPSCHTQFRINEKQLQIAGGKVRCGACLGVFQGVDNIVWEEGQAPAAPAGVAPAADDLDQVIGGIEPMAAEAPAAQRLDEATEPAAVEGAVETQQEAAQQEAAQQEKAQQEKAQPAQQEPAAAADPLTPSADEAPDSGSAELDDSDYEPLLGAKRVTLEDLEAELLADSVNSAKRLALDDDLELIPNEELKAAKQRERLAAREAALARTTEAAKAAAEPVARAAAEPAAAPEAPARPVTTEQPAAPVPGSGRAASAAAPTAPTPSIPTTPRAAEPRRSTASQKAAEPIAELAAAAAGSGEPPGKDDPFARLEAKQRAAKAELPAPGRGLLPGFGIAVGVLLLVGQVLLLRFDAWSQNPQIRPVYVAICAVAPCTVPPLKALDLMESLELSVRTHPEVENALMVDVLIANRAAFAQVFPAIELTFSDINNDVIAGRRFEPVDYLEGELKGESDIPAQTPVRIQLEIEDPGDQAVNWNIEFR